MSPIVEVLIREPPLFAEVYVTVPGIDATIEDYHYFPANGRRRYVSSMWIAGCDFDQFERTVRAYRYTDALRPIATGEDRRLYRLETTPVPDERTLFPYFRRNDITMLDNHTTPDGLWLRLHLPDRGTLKRLVAKLESLETSPEVERIYTAGSETATESILTDKQREALRLALEHGYFETPSEITLDELAEDLDVTAQSLSKHIRSSVHKLVDDEVRDAVERSGTARSARPDKSVSG